MFIELKKHFVHMYSQSDTKAVKLIPNDIVEKGKLRVTLPSLTLT